MISLPRGDIRIGLPKKTKRAKRKAEKFKAAPGSVWHNHTSISQGCHPRQVPRMRQFIKEMGITSMNVTDSGEYQWNRSGMKQWCKATGQCNIDETS